MGAWGYKLYECDTACDVRDGFRDWARLSLDGAGLLDFALARYPGADDPEDEGHSVFWLALADRFHAYGIDHPPLFAKAVAIIDNGVDAAIMRELDMDEADLARRALELESLKAKWTIPHPKPRVRKILEKPEPHCVAPGEIWAYPTQDGNPPNTYFSEADIDRDFRSDGWNAFVIGNTGHQLGLFALAFFMRLHIDSRDKPELETCRCAPISGVKYFMAVDGAPLAHGVQWATVTRAVLRKMRAEKLGSVDLSWEKIRSRLNGADDIESSHRNRISSLLCVYQRMPGSREYMDYAAPLDITLPGLTRK